MQELRSEIIGDRRVCLVAQAGDYYAITIEVHGPLEWQDISLRADQDLACRRYCQRVAEQQARTIEWGKA